MSARPFEMSDRPAAADDRVDVISEVLAAMRFTAIFYGRFELAAPWAFRVPRKPTSSFYVLARGRLRLVVDGVAEPLFLSAGDVVLLPRCVAHALDDGARLAPPTRGFLERERLLGQARAGALGGTGAASALISGCFSFSAGAEHPLLRALPPAIHLRADDPRSGPGLAATVQLITAESAMGRPGSALILGRLAEVLLVQAFRIEAASGAAGLAALADPAVSAALTQIHTRWGEPWTVAALASAVGLSRSGFAARFTALVGEPPLRYLAGWRMTKAASWLRETGDTIEDIATRVGYDSAPAFSKTFKMWCGVGPGAYRRGGGLPG